MIWKEGGKKKKKTGARTVSHGLPGLCQIYLTGSWRGNWLLAGTCFTYLHIDLLPELDRLMISSYAWTLSPMWSSLQYISSVQPDFQTGFTGAVTRKGGDFLQLATIGILQFPAQCSSLFRRAWNANRSSSIYLIYIFISAAWSIDWPFSGAVTRQGDDFTYSQCSGDYTHYMINAVRF